MVSPHARVGALVHLLLAVFVLPSCYLASCDFDSSPDRDECRGTDDYCECQDRFNDCKHIEEDLEGYETDDYCWELEDPTDYDPTCYDVAVNWFFKCMQVADCRRSRLLDCREELSGRLWDCAVVEEEEGKGVKSAFSIPYVGPIAVNPEIGG